MERTGLFWDIVAGRHPAPPAAQLLGWQFRDFDEATGRLYCSFEATPAFLNPAGTVQGGILAAMLDEAMGPVAAAISGGSFLSQTLEAKTSYLRPGRVGTIFADAGIVQRGREILFLEARLTTGDGKAIAVASATARMVPLSALPPAKG